MLIVLTDPLSLYPERVDRPVEFISRTLSPIERRYSQIDRETLSIVWSVKRFHKYVYARPFELLTDHEPLQHIYNPDQRISETGSSRVLRWAVSLLISLL